MQEMKLKIVMFLLEIMKECCVLVGHGLVLALALKQHCAWVALQTLLDAITH